MEFKNYTKLKSLELFHFNWNTMQFSHFNDK